MAKAPPKAAEETTDNGEAAAAPGADKKKKLTLLIIIGVVLLALAGGGTFAVLHFMGGDKKAETAQEEHGEKAEGEDGKEGEGAPEHEALTYFPFEPPFLTNFVINGRPRYLQLSLTLASRDKPTIEAVEKHMPLVRNRIVMLLSGEQFDLLRMRAGREALQGKLQDAIKQVLEKEHVEAKIDKVLFTNFVMQ